MPNDGPGAPAPKSLTEALREIEVFADLTDDQLGWFISHASEEFYPAGTLILREGDIAETLNVILAGQIRYQSSNPELPVFLGHAGTVTGVLPYSRLKKYAGNVHAILPVRVVRLHRDLFPEMLERIPVLGPRLVAVMADRIRDVTRLGQQREKLVSLAKLAAGLAHELNNPASAVQRSAQNLRFCAAELRRANDELIERQMTPEQGRCIAELERSAIEQFGKTILETAIERSDREEEVTRWLRLSQVPRSWELSPALVDANIDAARLDEIQTYFPESLLAPVISRLAAMLNLERLLDGISRSTERVTEIVQSVKEYSFLDQAPQQEVNLNRGISNTLTMLGHRLRNGIEVIREFDESIPNVPAFGVELNQVWTNLIENAIDAMGSGGILRIRTLLEVNMALVEVIDSGTGIPSEIQDRIFDPFFTTKEVGAGAGLGLDTVFRVVQKHRGDVQFQSEPGHTVFQVRLPLRDGSTNAPAIEL